MAKKKNLGGSLQNQLKAAGLVTNKQIRKAQKGIHRQEMRVKQGVDADEHKLSAEQALARKKLQDREQNRQLNKAAQGKALKSQIKQLIEQNGQRQDGDQAYNFVEGRKIKKIHVSSENRDQLSKGFLAIVKLGQGYQLVPEQIAQKIISRIPESSNEIVIHLHDRSKDLVEEDDPYKDFPIPDDLDW
ncbi:MAG: DUF2058 domain-containing protein [Pseudomonadales bacterium]|nr:DUF2058 domain-containing protein [Pseudomonadales bacterium]